MIEAATATRTSAGLDAGAASSAPPPSRDHVVVSGDTVSAIAAKSGVTVEALIAANPQIDNPSLIFPGDRLAIPATAGMRVVEHGDTFGAIAREAGLSVGLLKAANPQVLDIDRIFPGDRIALPSVPPTSVAARGEPVNTSATVNDTRPSTNQPSATQATTAVATTSGVSEGALHLSAQDVTNIKKTLQTEWVQSAGDAQARGIVDTILNRQASGHWGDSVADVVNARNQFSDINGPISRRDGRTSVDQLPESRISSRVDTLVDTYLAERAAGTPSSVGDNLNYANPHFSDARNLGWINALEGPVLGRGNAVHHHGTTPDLQSHRPGAFEVVLP
ncbi:LysM peptidoglycan-binding domain-containing protein [Novosphingobium gossypii]|uniref:LysM peptidoglycan-binding domain-containing protein n=1 Tax=Novosphingobium gossypii TaxID=1604774 RepID=UPI003D2575A3